MCVYSVGRRGRGKKNSRLCCSSLESQVRDLEIWPMASFIAQLDRQAEGCTALSANPSQQQGQPKILVVSDSESKVSFHSSVLPPADQPLSVFATSTVMNAAV